MRRTGVVADLATGELEEQVLEIGGPVQVADRVVVGECIEQGLGLADVEEDRLAAGLDALGERRMRCGGRGGAVAVDLDDVALEVLGDQLARRSLGDLPAVVEDDQPVAQALGLVHEVGREEDRLALLEQVLQPLPHQVARLRVEAGGRLVEQQQVGVVDERAAEREAPLHSARELARPGAGLRLQRSEIEQLGHALVDQRAREAEVGAVDAQVLGAGEVGIEAVELGDDADPLLGLANLRGQRHAERLDRSAVGAGEAEADADRRRLAGAVRADHAETFARHDLEREVVDDGGVAVLLRQVGDAKKRLGHARAPRLGPITIRRRPRPRLAAAGRPARRKPSARCRRRESPSSGSACSRPDAPGSAGRSRRTAW
jgi:hypothetical protein